MKPSDAAKQIIALLEEGQRRGCPAPSADLTQFLSDLSQSPGLKKPARPSRGTSPSGRGTRVAPARQRPSEADMAKTIDELAAKLRAAFGSDTSFEAVMSDPTTQRLSKPNVVTLFNKVFDTSKQFPKSLTKPDLFNAIRRERISRVRGGF